MPTILENANKLRTFEGFKVSAILINEDVQTYMTFTARKIIYSRIQGD